MVEKTASGRARTKRPYSPRFKQQKRVVKLPSLKTLKRNAQRKIELINNEEYVSNLIEDNYYKTITIKNGKLIINMNYKDYKIRKEIINFMRQMNKIL